MIKVHLSLQVHSFLRDLESQIVQNDTFKQFNWTWILFPFLRCNNKDSKCKFGMRCKFNHPKDKLAAAVPSENSNVFALPERPSELPCAIPSAKQENKIGEIGTTIHLEGTGFSVKPPALSFNSKGLPVSPGEPDCPFYLKTGRSAYLQVWSHLGTTKENRKGTMRRSCCCLHHALSVVGNTFFGEKKATQLTTLVLQFSLPKA
ncbi:hypothetical protein Prudu_021636 [Prunus dulcis]|uniref:C3H1-type domain-containing protein n=1 Tax=Prunus dulcis TaxID=3755 RepID=A0A4Y1RYY6_PRUDU|nr:hypothetical protein Prudu_021636 [Prunus dulcis]